MSQVEAPKPLKKLGFGEPVHQAGWPKVADAAIEAGTFLGLVTRLRLLGSRGAIEVAL